LPEVSAIYGSVKLNTSELDSGLRNLRSAMDDVDSRMQGLGRTGESVSRSSASWFTGFTSTLAAFVVHDVLGNIIGGLQGIAAAAIQSTGELQSMQVGLESLMAREIARGTAVQKTHQETIHLTAEEKAKLGDLRNEYTLMQARVQEETERLRQLTAQWGADGLTVKTHAASLEILKGKLADTGAEMNTLAAKEGQVVDVQETVYEGATSIGEALDAAREPAKKMLDSLADLSILSPYMFETVSATYKQAMAFGFASDEAMTFTKATLNVAAGVGADNERLNRMAYNLAQVRMQGKVTAMDTRQLAMAGFDLTSVLQYVGEQMGVTVKDNEDFNKAIESGKITWEDFTRLYAKYADENFGGASERMSRTLEGLKSTMHDVFTLTLPKVLGPAVEEVSTTLGGMLNILLNIRKSGVLEELGAKLGEKLKVALGPINDLIARAQTYFDILEARKKVLAERAKAPAYMPEEMLPEVPEVPEGGFIKYVLGEDAVGFLDRIKTGIGDIMTSLGGLKDWFIENWPTILQDLKNFLGFAGEIVSALTTVTNLVAPKPSAEAAGAEAAKARREEAWKEGFGPWLAQLGHDLQEYLVPPIERWMEEHPSSPTFPGVKGAYGAGEERIGLAAGTESIGNVGLLESKTHIGNVDVETFPPLPEGNSRIGNVGVATLPSLAEGKSNIGTVGVTALPSLPEGAANIGGVNIQNWPIGYQAGGIVTKPTLAMVGEAGPEAIVPLRGGAAGMGHPTTIVVQSVLPPNEFQLLQLARMLKPALEAV
jgi:tape measure domain-containing protein